MGTVTATAPRLAPGMPDWVLLVTQTSAGGLFWAAFTLFVRFRTLQDVVDEVLEDVVPTPLRKVLDRIRPRRSFDSTERVALEGSSRSAR